MFCWWLFHALRLMIEKLHTCATETSLLTTANLTWVNIDYTPHSLLCHSFKLTGTNNSWIMGAVSEEALKSSNKFVHRYLEHFSKNCIKFWDARSHLLEISHPGLISLQRKQCKLCIWDICHHWQKTDNHSKYALKGAETNLIVNIYDELFSRFQFSF